MNESENLKRRTVRAVEIHGENGGFGDSRHAGDSVAPLRASDAAPLQIQMRHFTRREYSQRSALLQPFNRLLQTLTIGPSRSLAAERIDKDAAIANAVQAPQQVVRHELEVGADGGEYKVEERTLNQPERMIGH